jgi:hypothetical protein
MKTIVILTLLLGFCFGCSFATRTKVAMLDSTSRPATGGDVQVFRHGQTPTRPYKEIAVYSLASHGGEAANVLQGFIDFARKQGADASIFDDSGIMMTGSDNDIRDGGVGTFQGTAIVWTDGK